MKRILILCLILAGLAQARVFRTTKSGVWNDSTVWAAAVPFPNADGDTVTIAATHSCSLNVDLSTLTTGLGKLADSGTLFLRSKSGLTVANNIIGNGQFRVGDSVTSVCSVNVYVNGAAFSNQITDAQYWGTERTGVLTGYLSAAYAIGATKLKLDRNMDIRVGDVVTISDSSTQGLITAEVGLTWGRSNYPVAAYDSVTDTLTLSTALLATRHVGDFVSVLTREIRFHHLGATAATGVANNSKNTQTYRNVWFNGWEVGCVTGTGMFFVSCAGSNNAYGGVANSCANATFSGTFTCSNNTYGGVAYNCTNATFSGTFTCSNNTNGGVANNCANATFSGTFTSTEAYQLLYVTGIVSGTWTSNKVVSTYRSLVFASRPWHQLVWLNYDGARRHRVFSYTGQITTVADLGSIVFNFEGNEQPMILDIPLIARATTFEFAQVAQKSASFAILPQIQLINPDADPLKTLTGTPLAADTMSNGIATDEILRITASGLTVGNRYTLRLLGQNASGTVTWTGRDIAEGQGQRTSLNQQGVGKWTFKAQ